MNAQSNQLEYAFKRNGVPYRIIGGTRFFDRAEIKDMLAYLCVIASPNDDLRLTRIINVPARGIGLKTVETAQQIAAANALPLFTVIQNADKYPELQRASIKLRQFANMMAEMMAKVNAIQADELYDLVLEKTGYIVALEEKNSDDNIARIENVNELKTNIINYMKDSETTNLAGFLDEVALYTDMDNLDRDADCVVMMTMHSAKGLEFQNVFIVGMEDGIFPSIRSIGEAEEMEEERRLCYVALTRARKNLHLCCAKQRMLFGRTTANKISRYVDEIPADNINKPEPPKPKSYAPSAGTATARPAPTFAPKAGIAPKALPSFQQGDMVEHKAFGKGMIVSLQKMGGDALVEIAFDGVGTKRLMLKAAANHMTKI